MTTCIGSIWLDDLRVPPGNRLEALKGDRYGQFSIRVNDRWRICFRWSEGVAYDVELVAGKRSGTADTDLRLCRFFGLSNGYWLRAQAAYDTEVAERTPAPVLQKVRPWAEHSVKRA